MKNRLLIFAAACAAFTAVSLISCAGAPVTERSLGTVEPGQSAERSEKSLSLSVDNKTNRASAKFTANYNDKGVVLTAEVEDSDVYTGIYYSIGFDDNVEYLVNLKTSAAAWDSAQTYHFLITADGETTLQKANSPGGFAESYAVDLKCVYGGNFSYKAERTDKGYRTEVFLGYDLLGADAASAFGNVCVCPAMRNTHDYADTVWKAYSDNGCVWNNASTFIRVASDGYDV